MTKGPYHILFEELYAGLAEHAMPVVEELLKRDDVVTHLACPQSDTDAFRKAYGSLANRIQFHDLETFDWAQQVDAMFSVVPGSPGPLFKDTASPFDIPRIAMPHGLTDKYNKFPAHFIGNPLGYFNVLLASGDAMYIGSWETYEQKHPQVRNALRHVKAGVPKTDRLFKDRSLRDEILLNLRLDPHLETVLYAPTYQKEASLEQYGLPLIEALAGMGINVLVRLHHLSTNLESKEARVLGHGGKDWAQVINDLSEKNANLRLVEGDSTPWFVAADLLVGDVSGASYEFIVQNKPVVFVDCPAFFAKHGTDGIAYWGRDAGVVVSDLKRLEQVVFAQLDNPGQKRAGREALIARLLYRQGDSAAYVATLIMAMMEGREAFPVWGPTMNQQQDILLEECLVQQLHALASEPTGIALFGNGAHTQRLLKLMHKAEARGTSMPRICCILDEREVLYSEEPDSLNAQDSISVCHPECVDPKSFKVVVLSTDYFQKQMTASCMERWGGEMRVIDLYEQFPWYKPDSFLV